MIDPSVEWHEMQPSASISRLPSSRPTSLPCISQASICSMSSFGTMPSVDGMMGS